MTLIKFEDNERAALERALERSSAALLRLTGPNASDDTAAMVRADSTILQGLLLTLKGEIA